jgi:NDP-sugar pyrophosphorylase family protein
LRKNFLDFLNDVPAHQYSLEVAFDSFAKSHLIEWLQIEELPSLKFAWQLLDFMKVLLKKQNSTISSSANIASTAIFDESNGPIVIDEHAIIKDFAKISGPAYIGKNVLVGEYSFIRNSSIEKDAVVGARTEIVRSLLETSCTIHAGYCADSIIGAKSKIAAGLTTANKRLDRENIKVSIGDKRIVTATNTLGVIIGESSNFGISVNTMPGTLIGAQSTVYPGVTVFKNTEINEVLKASN